MKRCPKCLEAYDDAEKFCELDGRKLLADPTIHVVEASAPVTPTRNPNERSLMMLVGVLGGVLISAALFVVYSVANKEAPESRQSSARVLQAAPATRQTLTIPSEPAPRPSATPLEEAEAENSPEPETQAEVKETAAPTKVNQGPISTGGHKDEPNLRTVIQLNDGTSLDVDEAWKEGQGIWYRRGGLVSFLDSKDVKSISTVADTKKVDASSDEDGHHE
ncbi:MAG TPA: hypothetical protein VFH15_10275 [Pyrinomonadaceae bacterium]|nr:hypothetical protein [Pyrinomonadaceae bacterium]